VDLKAEFSKREPWITHYETDGVANGGDFHALNDSRVGQFFETFPRIHNILELEGGHTLGSLTRALTKNGFGEIRILENNLSHPHRPAVTLAATTSRFQS
jgi:hypothetical protein